MQGDVSVLTSLATGEAVHSGDIITVDGGSGKLLKGLKNTVTLVDDPDFQAVLKWADKYRRLRINCSVGGCEDLCDQVTLARQMGADGIGCVNTDAQFCCTEDRLNLSLERFLSTRPRGKWRRTVHYRCWVPYRAMNSSAYFVRPLIAT